MYEINKSFLARDDLKNIWHYSFKKWGEAVAAQYLRELNAGIQELKDNPNIGKSRENIRLGYQSIQVNRHVIYYRIESKIIHIVRVLHERMLPAKHL